MSRRGMVWKVVALLFTVLNIGAAGMAARDAEPMHTIIHSVLAVAGVLALWWLTSREHDDELAALPGAEERLEQLQQSLDAVAIEVERIGEAQRFATKVQLEQMKDRS